MTRGTEVKIEKLRNIVDTGSARTSKMIVHRLPITYSLVPIGNQVTYIFCNIDGFQLFLYGGCFYLVIIIIKYRGGGWTSTQWCRTPTLAR